MTAIDLRRNSVRERERGWLRQDIDQIARLMVDLGQEYFADSGGYREPDKMLRHCRQLLSSTFNDPWHYVHVIRVAEKLVAIGCLSRSRQKRYDGHVHSVYVEPSFRGYGFGRRVTAGVVTFAVDAGMTSLEMPLTANKLARGLYLSMGFKPRVLRGEDHLVLRLDNGDR